MISRINSNVRIGIHKGNRKETYYGVKAECGAGVYHDKKKAEDVYLGEVKEFDNYEDAYEFVWEDIPKLYVNGLYDIKTKGYGYGVVLELPDKRRALIKERGWDDRQDAAYYRNVAGELKSAIKGMELAIENGIKEVKMYYSYRGINDIINKRSLNISILGEEYKRIYERQIAPNLKVHFIRYSNEMNLPNFNESQQQARKAIEELKRSKNVEFRVKDEMLANKLQIFKENLVKMEGIYERAEVEFDFSELSKYINDPKDLPESVNVNLSIKGANMKEVIEINHKLKPKKETTLYLLKTDRVNLGVGSKESLERLIKVLNRSQNMRIVPYSSIKNLEFSHENSRIIYYQGDYIEGTPGLEKRIDNSKKPTEKRETGIKEAI